MTLLLLVSDGAEVARWEGGHIEVVEGKAKKPWHGKAPTRPTWLSLTFVVERSA